MNSLKLKCIKFSTLSWSTDSEPASGQFPNFTTRSNLIVGPQHAVAYGSILCHLTNEQIATILCMHKQIRISSRVTASIFDSSIHRKKGAQ